MDREAVLAVIKAMAEKIRAEKEYLTDLDTAIGDGDHGINMARGFKAVEEKLPELADKDIGTILKGVGMQLVSTVGGASGPLYGTAFMKAGAICKDKMELTAIDFQTAFAAAIEGVKMRGRAEKGDKTMLDALCPAYEALALSLADGEELALAVKKAVAAAEAGVAYTKTIAAAKGRASYLGERSIGHQDPGATSSLFMLQVIAGHIA
ncbi:dihydroxyacetone kinase subunit DhaL [Megasphaera vaginalis (ex Srinivasan et al. 2021)]|uniref:phosphoenolpyruvate--glycerone phosphotransferase n=1 Tax=Megasphaera vaginalis (ex Srinivasan et al. 2021) TaxID=1111454 RepID=U7UHV1_9FIRM|nr:dihydroxyacetone kinase subunit DhaL [Megasphaera vaginalis (ex Srinivasan et al. 2021)]ERT58028.1 dihydroxyacetone kinase, L subunit [Megasphaera vaginalis (ex Srinivasan et al. 2021)]